MRIAFALALILLGVLAVDGLYWDWAVVIYLGRELLDLIDWVTIWNRL
jgi:hypothetical protein